MYVFDCPHDPPCNGPGHPCRVRFQCDASPPCNVLLDVWSDALPDHVCPEIAMATLQQVVRAWYYPARYLKADALEVYNARLPFWSLFARLWPLRLRKPLLEDPDSLPIGHLPAVEFLGVAITRMVGPLSGGDLARGTVTLLAPVEPVRPDGGAVVLSGSILPGEPPYLPEQWRFLPPAIDIQGEGDALEACYARAKELRKWYTEALLGKTVRSGRPPGTTSITGLDAVIEAIRAVHRSHGRVTQELVARRLYVDRSTLHNFLTRHAGLTWQEVRRLALIP